jgi:formate hydrogenlyase subunit 4
MNLTGIILIVIAGLLFPGVIGIVKAKVVGRKGPGILQPTLDMIRLFRKGSVYSSASSFIFQIAPIIYFATIFCSLLFLPFFNKKGLLSFDGDFIVFAYMLALGKFMMILAALDTGSSFSGMGANREALYSMIVEPAFFILLGSLALISNHISFYSLYNDLHFGSNLALLVAIVGAYLLIQIAMVENSRIPVDDPRTHLELTMIHEVMVLDYSGFDLGLIQFANGIKFAIYGALVANFLFASFIPLYIQIPGFITVEFVVAVAVGFLESFRARNKMAKNPQWIVSLSAIAVLVFIAVLILIGKFV